jgi:hypothetical protein
LRYLAGYKQREAATTRNLQIARLWVKFQFVLADIIRNRVAPSRAALFFDGHVYATAISHERRHSAADSYEISLRDPTDIARGPRPSRQILYKKALLIPCATQNSSTEKTSRLMVLLWLSM